MNLVEIYIPPTMNYEELFIRETVATGLKAIEQGIARLKPSEDELFSMAKNLIEKSHSDLKVLMRKGFIPEFNDYA